jgi:acetolactate synthase-1/2/3 large subunit
MRAVDAVMECLKAEGVDVVFGLPGGANLPTYDAFYDAGIRHVLVRHEAGGGHAAEGYAKATGKVGVCFATSGPGATNLVTPIADAMMDSVPVVFITGQVRTELLGTDGFQEADTIGITMPIVKHSFMIQHPLEIPRAIHEAFHIARSGRPGPVLIDIPVGPLAGRHPLRAGRQRVVAGLPADDRRQPEADPSGRQGARRSQAPGDLCRWRRDQRQRRRRAGRVRDDRPVPGDMHADGPRGIPGNPSAVAGMLGMHGTRTANYAMDEADLICAVGARFDDRITGKLSEFAPHAKFIHIDIDPAEISKNVPAHIPIVGDARTSCQSCRLSTARSSAESARVDDWWTRRSRPGGRAPAALRGQHRHRDQAAVHDPGALRGDRRRRDHRLRRRPAPDVGRAVLPLHAPRRWINSGGLGTMGFGLPAAMGAQVGCPTPSSA